MKTALRITVVCAVVAVGVRAAAAIPMGNRLELFVDDFLIERLEGTALKLHETVQAGVALRFDKPWEGSFCGYITVFKDGDRFRMYYRGLPKSGRDGSPDEVTCYAESPDGITWTKPSLRLFEVHGTRENNVVLAGQAPFSHNFSPFLDTRPGIAAEERYKAVAGTSEKGLFGFRFQASCLNRFIYVKAVKDLRAALEGADSVRGKVSTIGLAAPEDEAPELAHAMARWGATRVCPLGQMQAPSLLWRHDGRPALADLVTWTDFELS